jgi:hypothetical protein
MTKAKRPNPLTTWTLVGDGTGPVEIVHKICWIGQDQPRAAPAKEIPMPDWRDDLSDDEPAKPSVPILYHRPS